MCKCVYYCCDGSSLCTQGFYLLRQELHITSHGLNIFAETRMLHLCCCLHWLVLPSVHVPVVHTNGVVHSACVSEHRRDIGRVFMSALGGATPPPPPVPGASVSHRGCLGYRRHSFLGDPCPKTPLGHHCSRAICYWVDQRLSLDDSYVFPPLAVLHQVGTLYYWRASHHHFAMSLIFH